MKFDFILFENNTSGFENHFLDINIIADLLIASGYSVAIANYANEKKYCKSDIPIIDIPNKYQKPVISYEGRKFIIPLYKPFCYLRYKRKQNKYAKNFLQQVKGLANNFYCGTHTKDMSLIFLSDNDSGTNYYFWGLRSWWFTNSIKDILHNPFRAINIYRIKKRFKRFPNLKLFVSNEIIINEFLGLGFHENQLVIRPERILKSLPEDNLNKTNYTFTILSLGYFRPEKRFELGVDAFKSINRSDLQYFIRGDCLSLTNYRDFLIESIGESSNISIINKRLNDADYKNVIESSHFLLLCDEKQRSTVTNGTMMDALLNNRPFIAPDYLPYSYYINKYHIGLLFDPSIPGSLEKQIIKANELGVPYFLPYIRQFQEQFLIKNIIYYFNNL